MSASIGLGVVGAVIGALITWNPYGAAVGFAIGSSIGAIAFPPKRPDMPDVVGPRLNDLKVTSADPGQPIPLCFGASRLAGTVIWSTGLIETETTNPISGGGGASKGGGGNSGTETTFSYSTSVGILLCQGEIDGIGRIWADEAKLIRDHVGFIAPSGVAPCTDADISAYRALVEPWLVRQGYGTDPGLLTLYNLNILALATAEPDLDPRPVLACGYSIIGSGSTTRVPPDPTIGYYDPSSTG